MKHFLSIALLAIIVSACGSEETPVDTPPTTNADTTTNVVAVDTSSEMLVDTTAVDTAADLGTMGMMSEEEQAAQEAAEEEKNANAWDFCQCVREQKRLEEALMEEEDDAKIEALFDEMTALETNCPDLGNPGNQTSMDEKKAYERRVKKCLKGS